MIPRPARAAGPSAVSPAALIPVLAVLAAQPLRLAGTVLLAVGVGGLLARAAWRLGRRRRRPSAPELRTPLLREDRRRARR